MSKPVDLNATPETAQGSAIVQAEDALKSALALWDKGHALSQFNWGASALTADGIKELNELPGKIRAALAAIRKEQTPK